MNDEIRRQDRRQSRAARTASRTTSWQQRAQHLKEDVAIIGTKLSVISLHFQAKLANLARDKQQVAISTILISINQKMFSF